MVWLFVVPSTRAIVERNREALNFTHKGYKTERHNILFGLGISSTASSI